MPNERSRGHVLNDVTWPQKIQVVPRYSDANTSKTIMDRCSRNWPMNTLEVGNGSSRDDVNRLIAIPASLYLTPETQNTRGGHSWKFRVPAGCVDTLNYSFVHTTSRIWNQLPDQPSRRRYVPTVSNRLTGISWLCICLSAKLMLNISETTRFRGFVSIGAYRKVLTARRLRTSSMTSRDYDVILVTSQYSKSSHSETRTRIHYPCGRWTLQAYAIP